MPLVKFQGKLKFTSNDIDKFSTDFFELLERFKLLNFEQQKSDPLTFQLNTFHWMSIEAICLLNSIFFHLKKRILPFKVIISYEQHYDNSKRDVFHFLYFLIKKWRIQNILNSDDQFGDYFDITMSLEEYIDRIQYQYMNRDFKIVLGETKINREERIKKFINRKNQDLFNNYYLKNKSIINWGNAIQEITPTLNEENFSNSLSQNIDPVDISELIEVNLSEYFDNGSIIKNILSREIVENSIFHGKQTDGSIEVFTSIGYNTSKSKEEVKQNQISDIIDFFKPYKSFLEFVNIDFGVGITNTLRSKYLEKNGTSANYNDSDIIEFAFEAFSSCNSFSKRYEKLIPRGLFDVTSILNKFKGIVIIRSGKGECIFDYSGNQKKTHKYDNLNFKGTMVTIFLPNSKNIKKEIAVFNEGKNFKKPNFVKKEYLNLGFLSNQNFQLNLSIPHFKNKAIQNDILDLIYDKITDIRNTYGNRRHTLLIVDFFNFKDFDTTRKILYFLSTDFNLSEMGGVSVTTINANNQVVKNTRDSIIHNYGLRDKLIFHPLPCFQIDTTFNLEKINILGVQSLEEEETLQEILGYEHLEERNLNMIAKSTDSLKSIGNIIYKEENNFFLIEGLDKSIFQNYIYQREKEEFIRKFILNSKDTLYIVSGNYFQKQFIHLLNFLRGDNKANIINLILENIYSDVLFQEALKHYFFYKKQITFISVTLSSHLLSEQIIEKIKTDSGKTINIQSIKLENYRKFNEEKEFQNIDPNSSIFIICDVISTGQLLKTISNSLFDKNITFLKAFCFIDTRKSKQIVIDEIKPIFVTNKIEKRKVLIEDDSDLVASNFNYYLPKYRNSQIAKYHIDGSKIIRISSYTNDLFLNDPKRVQNSLIEVLELKEINFNITPYLIFDYLERNNSFHTYYINTQLLFQSNNPEGSKIIHYLLKKLKDKEKHRFQFLLYPKDSGIQNFEFKELYQLDLFDDNLEISNFFREKTEDGWKYLNKYITLNENGLNNILLIDDGSCSGSTLVQMIESLKFENINNHKVKIIITILSVFGRLTEQNNFLFSRINEIYHNNLEVRIKFYFGVQLNINSLQNQDLSFLKEEVNKIASYDFLPVYFSDYFEHRKIELKIISDLENTGNKDFYLRIINSQNFDIYLLLYWRNIIGRLNSFQFYQEDFNVFNNILLSFSKERNSKEYIIHLQHILTIIYHEQYFVKILEKTIPDIFSIIQFFLIDYIEEKIPNNFLFDWDDLKITSYILLFFKTEDIIKNLNSKKHYSIWITKIANNKKAVGLLFYKVFTFNLLNTNYKENTLNFIDIFKKKQALVPDSGMKNIEFYEVEAFFNHFSFSQSKKNPFIEKSILLEKFYQEKEMFKDHRDNLNTDIEKIIINLNEYIKYGDLNGPEDFYLRVLRLRINISLFEYYLKSFNELFNNIYQSSFKEFIQVESPLYIKRNNMHFYEISTKLINETLSPKDNRIVNAITFLTNYKVHFLHRLIVTKKSIKTFLPSTGEILFQNYLDTDIIKAWEDFLNFTLMKPSWLIYSNNTGMKSFKFNIHLEVLKSTIFKIISDNFKFYALEDSKVRVVIEIIDKKIVFSFWNRSNEIIKKSNKIGLQNLKKLAKIYGFKISDFKVSKNFNLTLTFPI